MSRKVMPREYDYDKELSYYDSSDEESSISQLLQQHHIQQSTRTSLGAKSQSENPLIYRNNDIPDDHSQHSVDVTPITMNSVEESPGVENLILTESMRAIAEHDKETLEDNRKRLSLLEAADLHSKTDYLDTEAFDFIKKPSLEEQLAFQKLGIGHKSTSRDLFLDDLGEANMIDYTQTRGENTSTTSYSPSQRDLQDIDLYLQAKNDLTDEEAMFINARDSYNDLMNILATPKSRNNSSLSYFPRSHIKETNDPTTSNSVLITNIQTGVPIKRKMRRSLGDDQLSVDSSQSIKTSNSQSQNLSNHSWNEKSYAHSNHLDPKELRKIIAKKINSKEVKEMFQKKKPIYHGAGGLAFNPNEAFTLSHLYEHIERDRRNQPSSSTSKRRVVLKKRRNSMNESVQSINDTMITTASSVQSQPISGDMSRNEAFPAELTPEKEFNVGGTEDDSSEQSEDEDLLSPRSVMKKVQKDAYSWLPMGHMASSSEEMKKEAIKRARRLALSKHFSESSISSSEQEGNQNGDESSISSQTSFDELEKPYPPKSSIKPSTVRNGTTAQLPSNLKRTSSSKLSSKETEKPKNNSKSTKSSSTAKQKTTSTKRNDPLASAVPASKIIQKMENEEIQQFRKLLEKGEAEMDLDEDDDFFEARSMMQRISLFRSYVESSQ